MKILIVTGTGKHQQTIAEFEVSPEQNLNDVVQDAEFFNGLDWGQAIDNGRAKVDDVDTGSRAPGSPYL